MAYNFDDMGFCVQNLQPNNKVILDDKGLPSIMVGIPKFKISDVISGASDTIHPAFRVGGVEKDVVWVSKFQNIVMGDRAYSLAGQDPANGYTADEEMAFCRNKGAGWVLNPMAVWAAVALWCRKSGTMPHGNNNFGSDYNYPLEKGISSTSARDNGKLTRIATGSGPVTWYHNWNASGIWGLNGNVWERQSALRIVNGEIQVIVDSNIADPSISNGASSTAWKAILADGTIVEPGTSGTLKYDWVSGKILLTDGTVSYTTDQGNGCQYNAMTLKSGLTAPEIIKALILYPDEVGGDYGGDDRYLNTVGERVPICGGSWHSRSSAGVFKLNLGNPRTDRNWDIGFRSAYFEGLSA